MHVADFDEIVWRIDRSKRRLESNMVGEMGVRRACIRDPEGVLIELMESDIIRPTATAASKADAYVAIRSVTLSVPDLDRAHAFWVGQLGLTEATGIELHRDEHEKLWGLDCAKTESLLLSAGEVLLELKKYLDPVGRPQSTGLNSFRQGILNVAVAFPSKQDLYAMHREIVGNGYRSDFGIWHLPNIATVAYVRDDDGNSIELLHVENTGRERMGFVPS
jgi:catechol 2,3-dioxygenase-like lactoylglutathione lyase family enzyme